jgi:1,4-dihydroxy-2-naphthoate octaprenyltransferase
MIVAAPDASRLRVWVLASRPKTLSAAIVPVLMGSALSLREPARFGLSIFLCALFGAIFIQIATNFINDALDFKKGADTFERIGPLRVTQAGLLSADAVMRGAYACFILAALCGVPLVLRGGWPLIVIGLASILCAYAYTGGPLPLAYHGLGELFVLIFFGFVAVGGTYYVLSLQFHRAALVAGFAAGSLGVVLIAINNLRDVATDRVSNKRTLAARFGERFARFEIACCALAPFAAAAIVAWMIGRPWILLTLLALPLAIMVIAVVTKSSGAALNRCLAMSGALQWMFGILFALGAVI